MEIIQENYNLLRFQENKLVYCTLIISLEDNVKLEITNSGTTKKEALKNAHITSLDFKHRKIPNGHWIVGYYDKPVSHDKDRAHAIKMAIQFFKEIEFTPVNVQIYQKGASETKTIEEIG